MKSKIVYQCTNCGATFPRWVGKCPNCGEWNTLEEVFVSEEEKRKKSRGRTQTSSLIPINAIQVQEYFRFPTNIKEVDRVLGGGLLPSSIILFSGEPGIGKSTLMLQILDSIDTESIYVSGEESPEQIKLRAERIGIKSNKIFVTNDSQLETITTLIEQHSANIIVIDSIQAVYSAEIPSPPGSVFQVRNATNQLMEISKKQDKIIILVGHINKEGNIAGPKVLEHIVDAVLMLEGEKNSNIRMLRTLKNRFGSTLEIGLFEMCGNGLIELTDPNKIFISQSSIKSSGTTFSAVVEGARCLIIEIQSLVSPSSYGVPQRNVNGYDFKRLQMILAVLDKKLGLNIRQNDIFVNITGGMFIYDTGLDLAIASSLVSSLNDFVIPYEIGIIGEIGLTGEVRAVSSIEKRVNEMEKLGFKRIILPRRSEPDFSAKRKKHLLFVEKISEAFDILFHL